MPILSPFNLWPDIEKTVVAWLTGELPAAKILTETGTDLADLVTSKTVTGEFIYDGVIQVAKVPGGGASDRINEQSLVDVYCFAADRGRMWTLARRAHAAMLELDSHSAADAYVDTVDCFSAPGEVPYSNPNLRRSVASYQLTTMPQEAA